MLLPGSTFKPITKGFAMKWIWTPLLSMFLLACQQGNTQEKVVLKTPQDSISYAIGVDIGKNLMRQSIMVTAAALARGIQDASDTSVTPLLTEEQTRECMVTFQQQLAAKQMEKGKAVAEENKLKGDAFLAENKKKEGVKVTPSGLQYRVITAGSGVKPKDTSTVSLNYRGTLIDGTEFDNTFTRGQPVEYPVRGFIKGWAEALLMMPVGSKWEIVLPPDIAYGESGTGNGIPPNSTLVFEVELLSIK